MVSDLVDRLRRALWMPPGVSDEEILACTKGTFLRAWTELEVALANLKGEILKEFERVARWRIMNKWASRQRARDKKWRW